MSQLRADLVGKDSHRGVTLTYAWLANQFGHFALGFIPTTILHHVAMPDAPVFVIAFWVSFFWCCFELANFLLPLLLGRERRQGRWQRRCYDFAPDWVHIAFDTFTDLLYFWLGAFVAALVCDHSVAALKISIILFLSLLYPSWYWYVSRIYLQQAAYPMQMRLSQWNQGLSPEDKMILDDFLNSKNPSKHLLLFGGGGSGKTSMGVAIGHELSLKRKSCSYTSAMKLMWQFSLPDVAILRQQKTGWTWRTAELLVIDDLHPGEPIQDHFIEVERFFSLLQQGSLGKMNRKALVNKTVVWVLGIRGDASQVQLEWDGRLQRIGVRPEDIFCVHLNDYFHQPHQGKM